MSLHGSFEDTFEYPIIVSKEAGPSSACKENASLINQFCVKWSAISQKVTSKDI